MSDKKKKTGKKNRGKNKPEKKLKPVKKRLDVVLLEKNLAQSRQRAQSLIMAGRVLVDNSPIDKPGYQIPMESNITIRGDDIPYVSRGGLKLEKAIKEFQLDVTNMVCMDVGASTGGFTDCLLQNGATKVFAIDVGYGQLDWKIRNDPRVEPMDRTNIRMMKQNDLPCPIDLAVIDTSFISLKLVVPAVIKFLSQNAAIVALIKPQFEVGKGMVGKGGIVRDPELHDQVISELTQFFLELGLKIDKPIIDSPVLGAKGNREFIVLLENGAEGL